MKGRLLIETLLVLLVANAIVGFVVTMVWNRAAVMPQDVDDQAVRTLGRHERGRR